MGELLQEFSSKYPRSDRGLPNRDYSPLIFKSHLKTSATLFPAGRSRWLPNAADRRPGECGIAG